MTLNSLSLGYDFGDNFLKKMGFSMIRIEVGANDVFRCSSVKAERGLSYPYARTMNFFFESKFLNDIEKLYTYEYKEVIIINILYEYDYVLQ